jgi:hAT family C-terminal dimerisation region
VILSNQLYDRLPTSSATSVDVERVFSRGRILLSHLRNRMTGQTTRALMCLNAWSLQGVLKDCDLTSAIRGEPDLDGDEDVELESGWDALD